MTGPSDEQRPPAYTATQVYDMARHLRGCQVCGDGGRDPEISASIDEAFPPGDMADLISTGHDPRWLAITDGDRSQSGAGQ